MVKQPFVLEDWISSAVPSIYVGHIRRLAQLTGQVKPTVTNNLTLHTVLLMPLSDHSGHKMHPKV